MTKILVAEDDPMTLQLIHFKLKQSGFAVAMARDGEEALRQVHSEQPDLVILDGMMPLLDGFEVLHHMKESPEMKRIPVIMLTARTQDADMQRGLGLGAADYVVKPFSPTELLNRVRKVLGCAPTPGTGLFPPKLPPLPGSSA
jgi:two-component system phosphate regulon response regulator PhoB